MNRISKVSTKVVFSSKKVILHQVWSFWQIAWFQKQYYDKMMHRNEYLFVRQIYMSNNGWRLRTAFFKNSFLVVVGLLESPLVWFIFILSWVNLNLFSQCCLKKNIFWKSTNVNLKVSLYAFEDVKIMFWKVQLLFLKLWDIMRPNLSECWKQPLKDFPWNSSHWKLAKYSLSHFRSMFHSWINHVIGYYQQKCLKNNCGRVAF